MENQRIPKQGEIYRHFKDSLYQIITVAINSESGEPMVVYQALYGDFKSYVRPLAIFISEVDRAKYPEVKQKYRFELVSTQTGEVVTENKGSHSISEKTIGLKPVAAEIDYTGMEGIGSNNKAVQAEIKDDEAVNSILLKFLDAQSYSKKLDVLTSNLKHIDDRLINDMAVALDCTVDEGPLDQRIQKLIFSLQTMRRFEDRRLR